MCSCNKKIFDVSLIENLIEFVFFRRYYLLATRIFLETLHKISLIVYFHLFFFTGTWLYRENTQTLFQNTTWWLKQNGEILEFSSHLAGCIIYVMLPVWYFVWTSNIETCFNIRLFNLILTESFAIEFILNHDIHQFDWLQMSKESVGVSKNCYSAAGMKLFGGRDKNLVVGGSLLGSFSWWGGWTNFWLMGEDPNREDADQCDCYKEYLFVNTFNWKHGFIFLIL